MEGAIWSRTNRTAQMRVLGTSSRLECWNIMAKVNNLIAHIYNWNLKGSSAVISDCDNQYGMSDGYQNVSAKYWISSSNKLGFDWLASQMLCKWGWHIRKGTAVFPQDSLVVRGAFVVGMMRTGILFKSEAGRNTTKVARDACISLSCRRMAPVYFGSYRVLLRILAKHMLVTINSVLRLHLFLGMGSGPERGKWCQHKEKFWPLSRLHSTGPKQLEPSFFLYFNRVFIYLYFFLSGLCEQLY